MGYHCFPALLWCEKSAQLGPEHPRSDKNTQQYYLADEPQNIHSVSTRSDFLFFNGKCQLGVDVG